MAAMKSPRLQLRWAPSEHAGWKWQCHYELVLPLTEGDIRREADDGTQTTELVVAMKEPSLRDSGGGATPCTDRSSGERYCDPPFRDSAHATWDAKLLGKLPVYVIAPDGESFLYDRKS